MDLGFLDLAEVKLYRGGAAENRNRNANLVFFVIDVFNVAIKVCKRTVFHANQLTNFKQYFWTRLLNPFFI